MALFMTVYEYEIWVPDGAHHAALMRRARTLVGEEARLLPPERNAWRLAANNAAVEGNLFRLIDDGFDLSDGAYPAPAAAARLGRWPDQS